MINLEDHKVWVDELDDFVIKYSIVEAYLSELNAPTQLEEALKLIQESTTQLSSTFKDLKL